MKKLILVITTLSSMSSYASIYTILNLPAQPSTINIKKAIRKLNKAVKNHDKTKNLIFARKLIAETTMKVKYNAAVYINGNKQFNDLGDEMRSWDFSVYCYKGDIVEAVSLINRALKQGYWDSDEERIDKAFESNSIINLKIVDGPNEEDWTVSFGLCS